jgi:cytochrome c
MQEWRTGQTWTEANLRSYIANPKELLPRGSMSFAGLRNPTQLNDLIAYLKTNP